MSADSRSIVLIGMMGSGKTTTGQLVASGMNLKFRDNDQEIERASGMSPADLLRKDAKAFRDLEATLIAECLNAERQIVLSVGGGAIEREETREVFHNKANVFWLRAPAEVLLKRLENETDQRPMLDGDAKARLEELLEMRTPIYQSLADHVIDVENMTPDEVAEKIIEGIGR